MPIWHKHHQPQHQAPDSFSPPKSTTSINCAPFCSLFLALSHLSAQCPALQPQLNNTLDNMHEVSLPFMSRYSRRHQKNHSYNHAKKKGNYTPSTQQADKFLYENTPQPRSKQFQMRLRRDCLRKI